MVQSSNPTLTVFTPTFNRAHTIGRTYESLVNQTSKDFLWMVIDDGSTDNTRQLVEKWEKEQIIPIRYIYKENGGLYTGYNTAYAKADTELIVCIDSDDFMPENAVELIVNHWRKFGSEKYAGITGLDFYANTKTPIGGYFPDWLKEGYFIDLDLKNIHKGDTKQVMRTELMKKVSPQIGFHGEKNFNPVYMLLKADNLYPSLFLNENLCFVDYQLEDSMSAGIWRQYLNSPQSFAKLRILFMCLNRSTWKSEIKNCIHYNSSTFISKDKDWLKNSPKKFLTIVTRPLGWLLTKYIYYKAKS